MEYHPVFNPKPITHPDDWDDIFQRIKAGEVVRVPVKHDGPEDSFRANQRACAVRDKVYRLAKSRGINIDHYIMMGWLQVFMDEPAATYRLGDAVELERRKK